MSPHRLSPLELNRSLASTARYIRVATKTTATRRAHSIRAWSNPRTPERCIPDAGGALDPVEQIDRDVVRDELEFFTECSIRYLGLSVLKRRQQPCNRIRAASCAEHTILDRVNF